MSNCNNPKCGHSKKYHDPYCLYCGIYAPSCYKWKPMRNEKREIFGLGIGFTLEQLKDSWQNYKRNKTEYYK